MDEGQTDGWMDGKMALICKFWKEVGNKSLLLSIFPEPIWGLSPFVPA